MGRSKMESQEKHREPHFDTHHIVLKERKSATLTGVKEVLSFDSEEVQLDTIRGHLAIKGKGLHVRRLTLERGEVDIDGTFVLRALFHLKTVGKFILDTIYFLVAAVFVFQMVFLCNYGTLRIFFGIAFVLGAAACHVVLGRSVSRGILRVIWGIRRKIIQPCVRKCKRLLKKMKKTKKNP